MFNKDQIRTFYNGYKAGEYGTHTRTYEQEGRLGAILSLLNLRETGSILDIGCGVGWLTRQYAREAQDQVIGIDFSEQSIAVARDMAMKEGLNNLEFQVMDAEELQFENDQFDCIICSEVLEHLLHPEKALNEMHRVLKHTGQIVVTTPNPWNLNMICVAVVRKIKPTAWEHIYDQPIAPLKFNKMVKNAGMRVISRKGTYYLPLRPRISPEGKLHSALAMVSKSIEKRNLFPYMGLYQVCLLHQDSQR